MGCLVPTPRLISVSASQPHRVTSSRSQGAHKLVYAEICRAKNTLWWLRSFRQRQEARNRSNGCWLVKLRRWRVAGYHVYKGRRGLRLRVVVFLGPDYSSFCPAAVPRPNWSHEHVYYSAAESGFRFVRLSLLVFSFCHNISARSLDGLAAVSD